MAAPDDGRTERAEVPADQASSGPLDGHDAGRSVATDGPASGPGQHIDRVARKVKGLLRPER